MDLEQLYQAMRREAAKVIVGQEKVLNQVIIALLANGHVLLEGVPGTAKTLLAKTLAHLVQAKFARIQFTPDLMPSDVTGTNVFDLNSGKFHLKYGPIFTQILLADEINRAPAKTQSALLEGMEERQVSIEGLTKPLPFPFMVLATQNPIEYEGTYPLPEAQLDRFLFKIRVDYAPPEAEQEVLRRYHQGFNPHDIAATGIKPLLNPEHLTLVRQKITDIAVEEGIVDYITRIAVASRQSSDLLLGGSPRASIALLLTSKVYAALQGREYVVPDDVKALVFPVYRHRVILRPEAEIEGLDADAVMERILAQVDVPR